MILPRASLFCPRLPYKLTNSRAAVRLKNKQMD
jgi:hypothetical protein